MRTPRIVSLISSATEIVYALGERLAGRSHECDYPAEVLAIQCCTRPRIPVNGSSLEIDTLVKRATGEALSIYEVFDDVLERIQPTHILTQTQCDVCAVSLKDVERSVARRLASQPTIVALQPDSLAGIWDDIRRIAGALGIAEKGERTVAALQDRMAAISGRALQNAGRPTVACIEWLSPLMAAGNWMPELVEMAGGRNLFGEAGKHSPWMSWEELAERDPDVIVAMPCGFDLARTKEEMYWLTEHPQFAGLKAARTGRVHAVDGNSFFNRPGPRVVESLEILAKLLHPTPS